MLQLEIRFGYLIVNIEEDLALDEVSVGRFVSAHFADTGTEMVPLGTVKILPPRVMQQLATCSHGP